MRRMLIRFAILFSVVLAGLHQPAVALEAGEACSGETVFSAGKHQAADHHSHAAPGERSSDTGHHHHGPIAFDLAAPVQAGGLLPASQDHFPDAPGALASRATAPPVEPPLA